MNINKFDDHFIYGKVNKYNLFYRHFLVIYIILSLFIVNNVFQLDTFSFVWHYYYNDRTLFWKQPAAEYFYCI